MKNKASFAPDRNNTGNRKRGRVTFKKTVDVRDIPSVSRQNENDPLWYGTKDYIAFQARNQRIMEMMGSNTTLMNIEERLGECTRGLESFTLEAIERSSSCRRAAYEVVFSLQGAQKDEDNRNPKAISMAYSRQCQSSKYAASLIGLKDRQHVKERVMLGNRATQESTQTSNGVRSPPRSPILPRRTVESEKKLRTSRRQRIKKLINENIEHPRTPNRSRSHSPVNEKHYDKPQPTSRSTSRSISMSPTPRLPAQAEKSLRTNRRRKIKKLLNEKTDHPQTPDLFLF